MTFPPISQTPHQQQAHPAVQKQKKGQQFSPENDKLEQKRISKTA
jgi:hypothetical protein